MGGFTRVIAGLVEAKEVFIADVSDESLAVASRLG